MKLPHFFRHPALMVLLCGLSHVSPGQAARPEGSKNTKPNILFILVDDMGWGDVGVFWQNRRKEKNDRSEPWQFTPALDGLASGGVMLTSHYCAAPVCAPSRASLLLGVSQGHANVRDNQFDKALQDTYTLGNVLQQAGYHTAAIGKWGLQGQGEGPDWPAHPLNRGFDYYLGYIRHRDGHEHYPKEGIYRGKKEVWENRTEISGGLDKCFTTDLWTAAAKRYITRQAQSGGTPFFLYLAYDVPHAVLELPTQPYPEGGGLNGGLQWTGKRGRMINTASGKVDSYVYPEYKTATYDDDNDPMTPEVGWPETYQRYASSCRRIDEGIGDLLTLLKDLHIDRNTLIVFTSDNGPSDEAYLPDSYAPNNPDFFNSFGPFDGIKRDTWEGGVREPTIVNWPGIIPANRIIDEPGAMYDWMATLADAAGIPPPARTDGVSLLPLITGKRTSTDQMVYVEYYNNQKTPGYDEFLEPHRNRPRNQMQMVRMGDLSGVRYDIRSADDDFEIYNVVSDPQERTNLAGDPAYSGIQKIMKEKVLQVRRPDPEAPRPYDSIVVPGIKPLLLKSGLPWKAYRGIFPWVADVAGILASGNGNSGNVDVMVMNYPGMLVYEGILKVPENGAYQFSLHGDAPFLMRIHEALLIDGSYGYESGQELSGSILLEAGFHPLRIYFLKTTGEEKELNLEWRVPGRSRSAIPAENFFYE